MPSTNWASPAFSSAGNRSPHWPSTVLIHKTLTTSLPTSLLNGYHVSDALRFLAFLALNVLFSVQSNEYSTDFSLYGWLTIANAGLALLLATRSNLFSIVLRLPSPVILQYHRWIGVATVAHGTTHISYNIQRYIATDQLVTSFSSMRIQVGFLAWICLKPSCSSPHCQWSGDGFLKSFTIPISFSWSSLEVPIITAPAAPTPWKASSS